MFLLQGFSMPKSVLPFCLVNVAPNLIPFSSPILPSLVQYSGSLKSPACFAVSRNSDSKHDPEPTSKPKRRKGLRKMEVSKSKDVDADGDGMFPTTKLRKPRRGRKSEAGAVEDYVRESLEQTFASIRQQNSEGLENMESVFKERVEDSVDSETSDDDDDHDEEDNHEGSDVGKGKRKKKMIVEADDPNWPLDADVGWGIRASEYFDQHPIKNVVGEDGFVIDWEGEIDDSWVKEINCLEWESFAFHPSPLVVLVFERYNRATNNWKTLKELEKAIQVYWSAKDRLPPRAVKVDINIERDLAYALKVKECPQILFLLGNRILYREKEFRTSDELVQMIAHFYYKARRPSWIDKAAVYPPC